MKYFSFFLIFILGLHGFSQDSKRKELDSLFQLLKSEKADLASLNNSIAEIYIDFLNQPDSARIFASKANDFALKKGDKFVAAESFVILGRVKMEEEQPDSASALFFNALMSVNSARKNASGRYDQITIDFSDFRTCELAAHIYANFASACRKKMNLSKAVDFYLRALRAYEIAHDSTVIRFVNSMSKNGEKISKENLSIKEAQNYLKRHPEDTEAAKAGADGARMLAGLRWTWLDLGELFEKNKDYNQALVYLEKAEQNAEDVGAKESHLKILGSIGAVYQKKRNYDSAIVYFRKLEQRSRELKIIQGVIEAETRIGTCYREKGDYDKALAAYEKVNEALLPLSNGSYKNNEMYRYLPERLITGMVFHFRTGVNQMLIGDLNEKAGRHEQALQSYYSSIKLMEEIFEKKRHEDDSLTLVNINVVLGNLYSKTGQHEKAAQKFAFAESLCERFINGEERLQFYKDRKEAAERAGDVKNAYSAYKKYIALRDTLFNQEKASEMADLQKRFEVEKKDADIDLLNKAQEAKEAELEKQKLVRNGFIAGSIVFLILAVVIFRSLQQNRKAKKIIEEQKNEVEHKNKEILDSIKYAKRIQNALMPRKEYFDKTIKRLHQK